MYALSEWHSRGYIPHWEAGEAPQSICFRLGDSLPRPVIEECLAELSQLPENQAGLESRKRFENYLDQGFGEAFLSQPQIGGIVEQAILFFDGERCRIHAWCVMPNHVHVLMTPFGSHSIASLVHSWKTYTARHINQALGRTGALWYREYFDRKIRDERHFETARYYIEQNPVKAGLCTTAEGWAFSSARGKGSR
ncbi:transposase [Labrys neptuniae]|uniref:REP-associated tyrosine transposase n=1 Tax=Labrys neptuniae TaxID=376174 RepID=UPI002891FE8F|nr:transposase [Labrys neptuniae]MDT3376780.1 transposase [Labrys neptuniae]